MYSLAEHLSEKVRQLLENMSNSGDSQSAGVADILNTIASNGEEQSSDEYLMGCAREIIYSARYFINTLKGRDYWKDENPDYPKKDWIYEVANGDTLLGYWQWVEEKDDDNQLAEQMMQMASFIGSQERKEGSMRSTHKIPFTELCAFIKGMSLCVLTNGSESTLDKVEYGLLLTNTTDLETKAGMFNNIHSWINSTREEVINMLDDGEAVWEHIEFLHSKKYELQNEHALTAEDFVGYLKALGFVGEVFYPEDVSI